jgi:hypothetical protein
MHPTPKKLVPLSMIATLSLAQVGCYDWVAVRPAELPKLNAVSSQTVSAGNAQVTITDVRTVRGPDGRLVEIKGEHDVEVTADGSTVSFEHPVEAKVADDTLTVAGKNREDTNFALRKVEKVEVRQYSYGKTVAVITIIAVACLGVSFGLSAAASH